MVFFYRIVFSSNKVTVLCQRILRREGAAFELLLWELHKTSSCSIFITESLHACGHTCTLLLGKMVSVNYCSKWRQRAGQFTEPLGSYHFNCKCLSACQLHTSVSFNWIQLQSEEVIPSQGTSAKVWGLETRTIVCPDSSKTDTTSEDVGKPLGFLPAGLQTSVVGGPSSYLHKA